MALTLAAAVALAQACAPSVAPETLLSVAQAESRLDPLTIGVNGRPHQALHPRSQAEATALANALLRRGRNLDLGLTQINARNLPGLGLTVADAFDPCRNLAGGGAVLSRAYLAAARRPTGAGPALTQALSAYNTGDPERGLRNGYVARVYRAAAQVVPAISTAPAASTAPATGPADPHGVVVLERAVPSPPAAVPVDVFARRSTLLVWSAGSASPSPPLTPPAPSSGDPS